MKKKHNNFFHVLGLMFAGALLLGALTVRATGATQNFTTLVGTTILEALSLSCGNATIATSITAGTSQSVQALCTVSTNGPLGFNLKVHKTTASADATKTLVSNGTWITDTGVGLTAYTPGTSALWSESTTKGLGFRVRSTTGGTTNANTVADWGSDETSGNAKYAAFPVADQTIYNYASFSAPPSLINIDYRVDIPGTQKAGVYTGTVLYTATSN